MTHFYSTIDLHMHSTVSDGTNTPKELLERVKERGISLFSLTDHDAVEGCATILSLLQKEDPGFICGVEFSCEDELGKYHILGYGYNPQNKGINALANTCHAYRVNRVAERLSYLEKAFDISFTKEEVTALMALDNPGKPHIANLLIKHGFADTMADAFHQYLNKFHGEEKHVGPQLAIETILQAGGIPVLAHPSYGSGTERIVGEEMEKRLIRLLAYGIRGVEAFYSTFPAALQNELLFLAEKYHLYVTAGSDYHGTNKPIRLGDTHLTEENRPKGLTAFLQNVTILNNR